MDSSNINNHISLDGPSSQESNASSISLSSASSQEELSFGNVHDSSFLYQNNHAYQPIPKEVLQFSNRFIDHNMMNIGSFSQINQFDSIDNQFDYNDNFMNQQQNGNFGNHNFPQMTPSNNFQPYGYESSSQSSSQESLSSNYVQPNFNFNSCPVENSKKITKVKGNSSRDGQGDKTKNSGTETNVEKLAKKREKNREAAKKCRLKKLGNIATFLEKIKEVSQENSKREEENAQLRIKRNILQMQVIDAHYRQNMLK